MHINASNVCLQFYEVEERLTALRYRRLRSSAAPVAPLGSEMRGCSWIKESCALPSSASVSGPSSCRSIWIIPMCSRWQSATPTPRGWKGGPQIRHQAAVQRCGGGYSVGRDRRRAPGLRHPRPRAAGPRRARSGKHCACTVPMATSIDDLQAIVAAGATPGGTT